MASAAQPCRGLGALVAPGSLQVSQRASFFGGLRTFHRRSPRVQLLGHHRMGLSLLCLALGLQQDALSQGLQQWRQVLRGLRRLNAAVCGQLKAAIAGQLVDGRRCHVVVQKRVPVILAQNSAATMF